MGATIAFVFLNANSYAGGDVLTISITNSTEEPVILQMPVYIKCASIHGTDNQDVPYQLFTGVPTTVVISYWMSKPIDCGDYATGWSEGSFTYYDAKNPSSWCNVTFSNRDYHGQPTDQMDLEVDSINSGGKFTCSHTGNDITISQ